MPVSGIVISCDSTMISGVEQEIRAIDGIEIHGTLPEGKIIAVIEADTVQEEVDLVSKLHDLEGVSTVRMAYHNFEDVA